MVLSKSFQLLFIAILAALGGLFVLFLFWDITLWVPAWVVAGMAFIVFLVALFWCNSVFGSGTERRPPNSVEYLVMIALIIVVFLTAITVASDPRWLWLLLPVWILPAMAIVLLLISSGLGFGLRREDGKIKFRSIKLKLELACGLGLLVLTILLFLLWINSTKDSSYPLSFDGNSNQLKQTVIVPTLDTPILERKSAIWCASFQIAWNKFKTELAKGPVEIAGAELVADRLNRGEQSEDDLEPGSFYSAAGLAKDWIMENIQADMAVNFPKARKVEFSKTGEEIAVAFGYLQANVTFDPPFLERDGPIVFRSQEKDFGNEVKFFGIPKKPGNQQLRDQVEVMYFADEEGDDQFAVDLCKSSFPNQVVLASFPKKETLGQTLAALNEKCSEFLTKEGNSRFEDRESLAVPNMHWRIEHHFSDVEGDEKPLLNPTLLGQWIGQAVQVIEFKLDRRNASVTSQTMMKTFAQVGPRTFLFNRPFLLYMKKRGAKHPFFVMWVDNTELLIKD